MFQHIETNFGKSRGPTYLLSWSELGWPTATKNKTGGGPCSAGRSIFRRRILGRPQFASRGIFHRWLVFNLEEAVPRITLPGNYTSFSFFPWSGVKLCKTCLLHFSTLSYKLSCWCSCVKVYDLWYLCAPQKLFTPKIEWFFHWYHLFNKPGRWMQTLASYVHESIRAASVPEKLRPCYAIDGKPRYKDGACSQFTKKSSSNLH